MHAVPSWRGREGGKRERGQEEESGRKEERGGEVGQP